METEAEVTKEIKKLLDWMPQFYYWKQWQGGRAGKSFSKTGVSDIIGCWKGRFVAIEIKAEGKKINLKEKRGRDQQEFIDNIIATGGIAFEANCVSDVVKGLGK